MTIYLTITSFGVFVLDKDSNVVAKKLTYPDLETSASEFRSIESDELTDSLKSVIGDLEGLGEDSIVVDNQNVGRVLSTATKIPVNVDIDSAVIKWFRNGQDSYMIENGLVDSQSDLVSFRRSLALLVARATVSAASEEKDLLVKHAIDAIGEIDKSINVVAMRIREWYSLHYPSLSPLIEDQEQFAMVVKACGDKSRIDIDLSESVVKSIMEARDKDIGADLQDMDIKVMRSVADSILDFYVLRRELEAYVTEMMISIAPNVTSLVGPLVGARLLSSAGSLKELARKPSSTIQLFGAEKALFRSIKTGADPPKHGIIFQTPEIHSAPYWQRGKIARALAGKLAIAARIDAYSNKKVVDKLRIDFETRVKEIQRQNPEAPPPKPMKATPKRGQARDSRKPWKKPGGRR
ncbi:MAG: C/D box methylation guide ribonucleoprotein complex aNOP56 subunit [Candidatus Thorarchaeota archaeon]